MKLSLILALLLLAGCASIEVTPLTLLDAVIMHKLTK
jgi:uncharacterized protein YcfL